MSQTIWNTEANSTERALNLVACSHQCQWICCESLCCAWEFLDWTAAVEFMRVSSLVSRCDVGACRLCDAFQGTLLVLSTVFLIIGGEWDKCSHCDGPLEPAVFVCVR